MEPLLYSFALCFFQSNGCLVLRHHSLLLQVTGGQFGRAAELFFEVNMYAEAAENYCRTDPVRYTDVATSWFCAGDLPKALQACLKVGVKHETDQSHENDQRLAAPISYLSGATHTLSPCTLLTRRASPALLLLQAANSHSANSLQIMG